MSLTLRPALLADIPSMHALDLLCFAAPYRFDLRTMQRFANAAHAIALLAEAESSLIGFVILNLTHRRTLTSAYVTTLDVHPGHRRLGLARQLMAAAEASAGLANVTYVRLHVSTANEPAIRFYESIGYRRVTLVEDFYAEHLHAWLYLKNLLPHES